MLMQIPVPGVGATNPLVFLIALIAGFVAFLIFRFVFRMLHFVFHLGCLAIVAVVVFFILRNVIK